MDYKIERGVDKLGVYWSVVYTWWYDEKVFAFGSGRLYEDFMPEVENRDWFVKHTLEVIEYKLAEETPDGN